MNVLRLLRPGVALLVFVLAAAAVNAVTGPIPPEVAPELEAQNEAVAEDYTAGAYAEGIALVHEYLAYWAAEKGTDSPEYCSMASNLGPLLTKLGDMAAADAAHREGISCLRATFGPESEDLASALNNYGSYLGMTADLGRAELALKESLRLLRLTLGDDHFYVAITLNNLGVNQQNQGNLVAGERTMREALSRLRTSLGADHPLTATAANNLGRLLVKRGEIAEAEPLLRESLQVRLAQLGPDHPETSIGRRDLGRLLRREGHLVEAESYFREALAAFIRNEGTDSPNVVMSRHELGRVLVDQKRYDEAQDEFATALALAQRIYKAGHSSLIQIPTEMGETSFVQGRLNEANDRLLAATAAYEQGRDQSGAGLSRATYLDSPWLSLAAVRLELADSTGAWAALAKASGRVLEDALLSGGATAAADKDLDPGTALIGWFDISLGVEHRSWAWSLTGRGVRWHRLEVPAAPGAAIAAFRQGVAEPGALGLLRSQAHAVWQQRFAPLEADLNRVDHVVVVEMGSLLGVPIGAMVDNRGRWLADRWTLSYAPSVGAYHYLRSRSGGTSGPAPGPALFVGDPTLPGATVLAAHSRRPSDDVIRGASHGLPESIAALPALPGTRDEVRALATDWPGSTVLVGREASEAAVDSLAAADQLRDFRVLHFATHALVDSEDADASALVLSQKDLPDALTVLATGEQLDDGLITTREIAARWRLDADLVTLSACNSALGRKVTGEGLVGFAHTFLGAGARSTLVSQWSVPDRATMIFMTAFYDAWRHEHRTRAAALSFAQHSLRGHRDPDGRLPYEHPYYWAPFVLVGDDR